MDVDSNHHHQHQNHRHNNHHNVHHLELILQSLKDKLVRGDELNANDLRSLMPFHNIATTTGRHDGNNNNDDDGDRKTNPINYLDRRFFLHGGQQQLPTTTEGGAATTATVESSSTTTITSGPQLVRYVGMVQDMLDPEYYPSTVDGKSAHFRDWNPFVSSANDDDEEEEDGQDDDRAFEGCVLAERVPLVIVPIPFATQWMRTGLLKGKPMATAEALTTTTTNMELPQAIVVPPTPQQQMIENRKRGRGEEEEEEERWQDDHPNQPKRGESQQQQHIPRRLHRDIHNSMMDVDNNNNNNNVDDDKISMNGGGEDWWPAGTCGTSVEDCPVLAKLCYDQLFRLDDHNETDRNGTADTGNNRMEDNKTKHWQQQLQQQHLPSPSQERRRLRLNDLVSLIGVLSLNPWEVDFAGQHPRDCCDHVDDDDDVMNRASCWKAGPSNNNIDSFTPRLPPPSRLPRLHVLSYQLLDLDELAAQVACNGHHHNQTPQMTDPIDRYVVMSVVGENDDDDAGASNSPTPPPLFNTPLALTHHLMAGLDPIVTQAIWMTLLSKAERRREGPSSYGGPNPVPEEVGVEEDCTRTSLFRVGPSERALGCLSLQISTPDLATSRSWFDHLAYDILPTLCPVVATIECDDHRSIIRSNSSNNNSNITSVTVSPTKDENGKMGPSPLQLPAGSVVLVLYNPTVSGNSSRNSSTVGDGDVMTVKTVLHELVQHHRLPYTFEGNVTIPFEADYRVIIVTTQTQCLPCSWTVFTNKGASHGRRTTGPARNGGVGSAANIQEQDNHYHTLMESSSSSSSSTVIALREALCLARNRGNSSIGNIRSGIRLNPSLLERAQQDFLERRHQHTSTAAGGDSGMIEKSLPGEDDFHRWLNLAKLQSISRCAIRGLSSYESSSKEELEATVEDWQDAMQLDDIIRGME